MASDDSNKYQLTFKIDNKIVERGSTDILCIAKRVDGKFTTVFADGSIKPRDQKMKVLSNKNKFEWQDEYRVFVVEQYKHGMLIESASDPPVNINFGQQVLWEKNQFGTPDAAPIDKFPYVTGSQSPDDSFIALHVTDFFHLAVQNLVDGKWRTTYVDPDKHNGPMDKVLTPQNEYMIFWNNMVQTDYMIDQSEFSYPYRFKYENAQKTKTIRFGYAKPNQPEPGEESKFYEEGPTVA